MSISARFRAAACLTATLGLVSLPVFGGGKYGGLQNAYVPANEDVEVTTTTGQIPRCRLRSNMASGDHSNGYA